MKKSLFFEVLIILAVWAGVTTLMFLFGAYEGLYFFSRRHETWELDEIILSLPILLLLLSISISLKLRRISVLEAKARQDRELLELAHQQVLQAQKFRDEFLTNTAHELRTPLNGAMGMLDLLDGTPLDEEQAECVRIARGAVRQLSNLLGDVLYLARTRASLEAPGAEREVFPAVFSPAALTEQVLEAFTPMARDAGVLLAAHPGDAPGRLYRGNIAAIRQIVFNLTGNALKFTSRGRVDIRVAFEPRDGRGGLLRISVSDTGPGIDAGQMEHVSEPFVHRDGDTARSKEGLGLGLSIVKRLSEAIGAEVSLVSSPGQGSVFTLSAPVLRGGGEMADSGGGEIRPVAAAGA